MKAAFFLVGIFALVIVTTSLDDDQCSKCAFNTDFRNNEPANECCKYFKDTCCTAAENNFLHTMFIVAIVVGVIIFWWSVPVSFVVCAVACAVPVEEEAPPDTSTHLSTTLTLQSSAPLTSQRHNCTLATHLHAWLVLQVIKNSYVDLQLLIAYAHILN